MWVEIIFSIISILSLIFCTVIIIDRTIFTQKMHSIETGMTGKEIQEATGLKIRVTKIENRGTIYYAKVHSFLTLFKYRLAFCNGKLVSKQRD